MLFDLYSHSKQRAQQADLTLNILLNIFDPGREGQIPVICVKTGLVGLCGAQLEEKYRILFTAASCGKSSMTKKELSKLNSRRLFTSMCKFIPYSTFCYKPLI